MDCPPNLSSGPLMNLKQATTTPTATNTAPTMIGGPTMLMAPVAAASRQNVALVNDVAALQMTKAVSDLMAAIDMLPLEKKSSFQKANKLCPGLVQVETAPAVFLQHDNFNYWKAADRLASHWMYREKFFGDRAFLPMTQTGNGALTKDDIVTLHTGSHARLSSTPAGQPVIFTDRRRILSSSHREHRLRCFWYMVYMMSREENASTLGVLFLVLLVTPRPSSMDYIYMQQGVEILNVMPTKFHMHLLSCVSKTGKWNVAQKVIRSVASYCLEAFGGLNVFTETSQGDLKDKLVALGCVPEGLPSSVGGVWKYEEFTRWCRNRQVEEQYYEELHLPKDKNDNYTSNMSAERKRQRTKSLNVLHSRQKRERRKAEQQKMQEDCNKLHAQNWALQKEHSRLQDLLLQAKKIIEGFDQKNRFQNHGALSNSFDDVRSSDFASAPTGPMASVLPLNSMQNNDMQTMMMSSMAVQPQMSRQAVSHGTPQTVIASTQQPMSHNRTDSSMSNQVSPVVQTGQNQTFNTQFPIMGQADLGQESMMRLFMNQQSGQLMNSSLPNNTLQAHAQMSSHNNMNHSMQQTMMPTYSPQDSFGTGMNQSRMDPAGRGSNQGNVAISRNNTNINPIPTMLPSSNNGMPPDGGPNDDPFAPLDAQIDSIIPEAPTPAPIYNAVSQPTALRESVPQEFEGYDIPEPDPIPENPMGFPAYQTNRRHFG